MIHDGIDYRIEVEQRAAREGGDSARFVRGARLLVGCRRCSTEIRIRIDAAELQRTPSNQYIDVDRAEHYRHCITTMEAFQRLAEHHCYPSNFRAAIKGRVDGNASTKEQYEALSVVFAELASKEP